MTYYERNLPHWHPEGAMLFITWRLYGSLPADFVLKLRNSKEAANLRFKRAEAILNMAENGPLWLKHPRIAEQVESVIFKGAREFHQYLLWAYVVMPNHVHMLITPRVPMKKIMEGIKGVSAYHANRLLERRGKTFWQQESFDHWVRNDGEETRIRTYIEENPVKAGLCVNASDWPWSSVARK